MKLKKVRNKRLLLRMLNRQMQDHPKQNRDTKGATPQAAGEKIEKSRAVAADNDEPPQKHAA